ncbi:MAG: transglutaminaseTgpA domain-containing protein [Dissulfurispiraceae bacterium]
MMIVLNRGGYKISIRTVLNGLTYVVGGISLLSVIKYVGMLFSLGFVFIFITAVYFDYRRRYEISRKVLNIVLVIFIIINFFRITLDNFAAPVVETILILMAVKFLEDKRARDYMQIYALSTFLLAGSALLSMDLQFLVTLVLLAFLSPLCFVLLTFYSQQDDMSLTRAELQSVVSKGMLIPLVSIPLTALMFVILPRTGLPLLSFLNAGGVTAGFSDHVTLGDISSIQENATVILRVRTEPVAEDMLYWRGIVLDYFDGTSWKRLDTDPEHRSNLKLTGKKVYQTVYLEPYGNKFIFALDKPVSVNYRDVLFSDDLTLRSRWDINGRVRYGAVSVLSNNVDGQEGVDTKKYLQLPRGDFGKIVNLVRELSVGKSEEETAQAVLQYLSGGRFAYSIRNLPVTAKPIEDFLFTYRYGNCEFFASTLAVMLRTAGIPSRLVCGYRGGYYNTLGGYYLVTQNNAHVWVEAYLRNKGWVRMDPTPAVISASTGSNRKGNLSRIGLFFDTINYFWNSMIIGYDLNRQISLFTSFKNVFRSAWIDVTALKFLAARAFVLLAVSFGAVALLYRLIRRKAPERRMIDKFTKKMRKYGYSRSMSEGLQEFTAKIEEPGLREKVHVFTTELEGLYYRDKGMTRDNLARLRRLLDDI